MKKIYILVSVLMAGFFNVFAIAEEQATQRMDVLLLQKTISKMADEDGKVEIKNNAMSFEYDGTPIFCVWDVNADRMRLVSPIAEAKDIPAEYIILALQANYHSVLDPRYAIGDGIMYSAFIHPLSPLSVGELESAIKQVMVANKTFGTEFSSGALVFPGARKKTEKESDKIIM